MPKVAEGNETRSTEVLSARYGDPKPTATPPSLGGVKYCSIPGCDALRQRRIPLAALAITLGVAAASMMNGGLMGEEAPSSKGAAPLLDVDTLALPADSNISSYFRAELSTMDKVRVFVYDDPSVDNSDLIRCYRDKHSGVPPWQDERADMAQDMGEIWLHRALLEHPWRVLDPEEADIFYVPIYPVLGLKLLGGMDADKCAGRTQRRRLDDALLYLDRQSKYFNRFGGADHVVVCAWWNCRHALSPWHRMMLRRAAVGINERISSWTDWACAERSLTVPYTASSVMTRSEEIGGRYAVEERDIPFFFVGTGRKRPERQNMEVVRDLYPDSVIELGDNGNNWGMDSIEYAEHMTRSRFCFCPRGDTATSRRIFDAVSAGCIPVLTEDEKNAMPFREIGLNYSQFAVVAPKHGFDNHENVTAVVRSIASRSEEQLASLREGLKKALGALVYGVTTGPDVTDMHPFQSTAARFLQAARLVSGGDHLWSCPPVKMSDEQREPRTNKEFPPPPHERRQWLFETETIVHVEHSLLLCAPPNTGSLQFRMLAKRMQGVSHWAVSDDRQLLFDPVASELPLLDLADASLMNAIYKDSGSGWIKVAVARDPVTRLLSAYLDLAGAWQTASSPLPPFTSWDWPSGASSGAQTPPPPSPSPDDHHRRRRNLRKDRLRRGLERRSEDEESGRERQSDWELRDDEFARGKQELEAEGVPRQEEGEEMVQEEAEDSRDLRRLSQDERRSGVNATLVEGEASRSSADEDAGEGSVGEAVASRIVPTFAELLGALEVGMSTAPPALRPVTSLCGIRHSPFDTIIPFETLHKTSTEVLKSLPGGIWDEYGASGWGPHGENAFMEFDYGGVSTWSGIVRESDSSDTTVRGAAKGQEESAEVPGSALPRRARDLFDNGSCAWTEYYSSEETLETVFRLYKSDYNKFGWYSVEDWKQRLKECQEDRR